MWAKLILPVRFFPATITFPGGAIVDNSGAGFSGDNYISFPGFQSIQEKSFISLFRVPFEV